MSDAEQTPPTKIHPRVAACIAREAGSIDYQLLVDRIEAIKQARIAAEEASQRGLGQETALLIGPHLRTITKTSAWEQYKNENR